VTRLLLFVLVAACSGSPAAPPAARTGATSAHAKPRSPRALPGYPRPEEPLVTTCTLRGGWEPDQPHELRFRRGGRTFATVNHVDHAALELGEDPASPFVELRSRDARLWGVVVADRLLIHPARPLLLDGYLAPGPTGILRWAGARSEPAAVEVRVPGFVEPSSPPHDEVRCSDLSIDEVTFDPRAAIDAPQGQPMVLRGGKAIPLSREPTGPPAAELRFADSSGTGVEVIERSGDRARIAIPHGNLDPAEDVLVVGWVPASSLLQQATGFGGSWGSAGERSGSLPPPRKDLELVSCPREVPLVAELEGEQHLVGAVNPGVPLEIPPGAAAAGRRLVEIAVRTRQLEAADDVRLLAMGSALSDCTAASAPER
jgi:hypothetical protein